MGKWGRDAERLFREMKETISPEKLEEDLEKLGYAMQSTQAQELFQTAQQSPLLTDALGTMVS